MTHLDELEAVIKDLHGVELRHVASVPFREEYEGRTVWVGLVDVFEIIGQPKASGLYGWIEDADGNKRHFLTLNVAPVGSAEENMKAAKSQKHRIDNDA